MGQPETQRLSLEELRQLAVEADVYINEPRKQAQKKARAREVIPMLDEGARGLYIDEPVRIYGVHARAKFDYKESGIRHYLSPGQAKGISEGFDVMDYDHLSQFFAGADERQLRLLYEIRERAIGSLGIVHLLRQPIAVTHSRDRLTTMQIVNRYWSPVATSVLFPEETEKTILDKEDRYKELTRLIETSKPEVIAAFDKIVELLAQDNDPLVAVSQCAIIFAELCKDADVNTVAAAHDYLNILAGPMIFNSIYSFSETPPPSIIQPPYGNMAVATFAPSNDYKFLVTGLAVGSGLVEQNGMITPEGGNSLFITGKFYSDGMLGAEDVYMPAEKVESIPTSIYGQLKYQ